MPRLPSYRTPRPRHSPYDRSDYRCGDDGLLMGHVDAIVGSLAGTLPAVVLLVHDDVASDYTLDALPEVQGAKLEDDVAGPTAARMRVAEAFVSMMFALRRKYWALLAVAEFLRRREDTQE